ncbi:MAG TPA: nucleobase:cation symporter-2 family protein [Castellaniella sp.]|uniref:nucleobase:cation symporter-2 family protein n=1 Tax=Castellaniella sp. TaxID=1955812 RepID=UPI002F1725C9
MSKTVAPVDEILPFGRLAALGIQHVLVMYAGAVAVPLIIGRALHLTDAEVSMLIAADLFACGIATIIQSWGATQWFGIKLPVMMGVSFAPVGPMIHIAGTAQGHEGAQLLFGTIIAAGIITMIIAPWVSKLLRFFPPVVTGTIIAIIGITLMKVGINWIFGNPFGPTAPNVVNPDYASWLNSARSLAAAPGSALPAVPQGLALLPTVPNPRYADLTGLGIASAVLVSILLIARFCKGFIANIAVLLGIVVGAVITSALGMMTYDKVARADWFDIVLPFHFGMPRFDFWMIVTMVLVMIVILIESTGMFLALSDMTGKEIHQKDLARGLRTDGLGTLIGGIFNTFPYSSFSQNVGLVAVTGVRSRYVCVVGGVIMLILGMLPKLAALVESLPTVVLGGAGLVMFGMVTATGIRILGGVDFRNNAHNAMIVAISIGVGMIPVVAPSFRQWMPVAIHPLIESGILLTSISAVALNLFFNGAPKGEPAHTSAAVEAAKQAAH